MNSSSTQVPFMIAAFIAVIIHTLTSESTIDHDVNIKNKVKSSATVVMVDSENNKEISKLAAR